MDSNCITYHIDKHNRIVHLSDEWDLFAITNKANHLTRNIVLNRNLNDFITDAKCQHLYEMLIDRSRKNNEIIKFPFRCDSPKYRRFMSMDIIPLEDESISFKSCIESEEPREAVLLLDPDTVRSNEFIIICSWCKKIKLYEDCWVEVEEAINKLDLFGEHLLPGLSHGICPNCYENAKNEFLE